MKWIIILTVFFVPLVSFDQKKYELYFMNNDYKVIKKYPQTVFKDSISLKKYTYELQQSALKKGYLLASVDSLKKNENNQFHCLFTIGNQFKNASLTLPKEEQKFIKRKANINEKLLLKAPLTPKEFNLLMNTLQNAYLDNGYPFIKVQLEEVEIKENSINASISIDKGQQLKWNKLIVKGDSSISKKFVASLIGIKPKTLYSESDFMRITQKIKQIIFFEELKPAELLFTPEGVDLYTYLKSKPLSSVNGIIGLQPNPVTGKLNLTGELTLKLQNVLKRGELLYIDWRSIQAKTQALKTKLSYPYLFNTRFGIDGSFDLYKRDTTFLEMKGGVGVNYYLSGGSYVHVFYQNNSSNLLGNTATSTIDNLRSVKTNAYGLSFIYNKIDYLPNPTRGIQVETQFSAGIRSAKIPDSTKAEKTTVYKAMIQISGYIPLAKRHVLALKGSSHLYSAPLIFANEAHRFGGLISQRGFNEEELLATAQITSTVEYRFLVDKNSYAFAFYDMSWYENNSKKYYNDTPFGFGAGFSFGTKIGVFSISYALGKQFSNPIRIRDSKFHFGYVAFF